MSVDFKALKQGGFMRQKDAGYFSLRLHLVAGQIDADKLMRVSEIANKYGKGYLHLTSRQGIEIPYVHLDNVDAIKKELEECGVPTGVCGPRVRTVTACQGEKVCPRAMIDCIDIADKVDELYYGKTLPHKFKFAITGCPAGCVKPEENDIGVQGAILPRYESEDCTMCGLCKEVCYSGAIDISADLQLTFDESLCNNCGECVKSCPMSCWVPEKSGYLLFVGGKMGKKPRFADEVEGIIEDEAELFKLFEKTMDFFTENGLTRERFGDTLDRVGIDKLSSKLGRKVSPSVNGPAYCRACGKTSV
ncbi:4Fe-4S binding protein [Thermodesulfobacteriota bacterium]